MTGFRFCFCDFHVSPCAAALRAFGLATGLRLRLGDQRQKLGASDTRTTAPGPRNRPAAGYAPPTCPTLACARRNNWRGYSFVAALMVEMICFGFVTRRSSNSLEFPINAGGRH